LLAGRGFALPRGVVERDGTQPYSRHKEVKQAWLAGYLDPEHHWELYEWA